MLQRRDIPPHRVPGALKEGAHDVRVGDGEVHWGAEVLLHPALVEEGDAVLGGVDG